MGGGAEENNRERRKVNQTLVRCVKPKSYDLSADRDSRLPLQHLASQLQLVLGHLDNLLDHSLVDLLLHFRYVLVGRCDEFCPLFQQSLGGLTVDGFFGELGDDGEGGFVSLEEVRKRSGVDGETGDTSGHSVGSAKG
jgi:hypothetical protein